MIKRLLTVLRLVDPHDGLVSLTNLGLMVAITKIAVTPAGPVDLAVLLGTLLAYHAKRLVSSKVRDTGDAVETAKATALEAAKVAGAVAAAVKDVDQKIETLAASLRLSGKR
jgi:nitrate reductase gamma subunit